MGFTPLDGIMMGTRCGAIDPAIVPFIMEKKGFTPAEMDAYMNKKCGFLGISGISSDARDLEAAMDEYERILSYFGVCLRQILRNCRVNLPPKRALYRS